MGRLYTCICVSRRLCRWLLGWMSQTRVLRSLSGRTCSSVSTPERDVGSARPVWLGFRFRVPFGHSLSSFCFCCLLSSYRPPLKKRLTVVGTGRKGTSAWLCLSLWVSLSLSLSLSLYAFFPLCLFRALFLLSVLALRLECIVSSLSVCSCLFVSQPCQELLFGEASEAIASNRICSVQVLSGTGGLRVAAEFIHTFLSSGLSNVKHPQHNQRTRFPF